MPDIERYKDFAEDDHTLSGEKELMTNILGKEITILAWKMVACKVEGRRCVQIQFKMDEDKDPRVVFTNSEVLIRDLEKYNRQTFITTIRKVRKYYTFS